MPITMHLVHPINNSNIYVNARNHEYHIYMALNVDRKHICFPALGEHNLCYIKSFHCGEGNSWILFPPIIPTTPSKIKNCLCGGLWTKTVNKDRGITRNMGQDSWNYANFNSPWRPNPTIKYIGENKNIKFSPTLRSAIFAAAYMSNIFTQTLVESLHV